MSWLQKPFPWVAGILLLAIGQTAALGAMLWDRISILRSNTVITLKPRPVDPRDLFRGDYVILTYDVSRHEKSATADEARRGRRIKPTPSPSLGRRPWIVLAKKDDAWRVVSLHKDRPQSLADGTVAVRAASYRKTIASILPAPRADGKKGEITYQARYWLNYGIERFYVPEGTGRELEKKVRKGQITVDVAIASDGRAGIKALRVDGKIIYQEPWF